MQRSLHRRALLASSVLAASVALGAAGCGGSSAPAVPRAATVRAVPSVTARIDALERSYAGRIGAFALDTGTGRVVAHRADERFAFASTFKAALAATVLHKARVSDPGLLHRRLHWTADDLLPNSPVSEQHVADGLTAAELCRAAITQSDNTAANVLLKQVGGPAGVTRYLRSLGDPVSRLDHTEPALNQWKPGQRQDTVTPAAIGRDLASVTVGRALPAPDRAQLNAWLRATVTGDARIRAGVPKNWLVGDKTGTGSTYGTANDIAVVTPPGHAPVIIAVYTNRNDPKGSPDESVIARTATLLVEGLGLTSGS
ncbi:class A beta-lactamase [Actinomadura rayongensis]|uniref:Beta-lactamase n=1 Tax=Actinomadura rayongensis TaxID=1429076 RepID=A0A6I4W1R9_9ACTN|nr:class A beta-lactamase [Actinomadura rayongensis]MXQ64519.1 class A beta-lactamase [Actinomadura rayongensis]